MKIKVTPHTITIERDEIINQGEYNITPCVFEFTEEYENLTKEAIFSTCDSTYKVAILNNQCTIPSEVIIEGSILLGVYAYELEDEELKLRYSPTPKYFNIKSGSYREGNDPELPAPSEWERVLALINTAITETNNLNIEVNKEGKVTHVILTKKDGTTKEVDIEDGKSLEFNWRGTELGVRVEGQSQYEYVDLKGSKGDAGAIKMQIVAELPATGSDDTIYLVPLEHPDIQGNNYAEYVWINGQWELLGKIGVQVDLTDYYTKSETNNLLNNKQDKITNDNKLSASLVSGLSTVATSGSYNDLSNKPDLSVYLNKSSVVNANSTTAGETYDVRYINGLVGDINSALDTINGEVI